eukprot:scaffold19972_cov128-Isochrysis_galbana.AAC.10
MVCAGGRPRAMSATWCGCRVASALAINTTRVFAATLTVTTTLGTRVARRRCREPLPEPLYRLGEGAGRVGTSWRAARQRGCGQHRNHGVTGGTCRRQHALNVMDGVRAVDGQPGRAPAKIVDRLAEAEPTLGR